MITTRIDYEIAGTNVLAITTMREFLAETEDSVATLRIVSKKKRFLTKKELLSIRHSGPGLVRPQELQKIH